MVKIYASIALWAIAVIFVFYDGQKIIEKPPVAKAGLKFVIAMSLVGAKGTYSVVVKNLKTGEEYAFNEEKIYHAGSLYKLWIMAEAYSQIQAGILTKEEILSQTIPELNNEFNIASEGAELVEGVITFSTQDALSQMITISHNYAALLLTEKVKLSRTKAFLDNYGFHASTIAVEGEPPATSASDIALFFEKLYKEQLANKQYTNEMLTLLKKQQLNNKLPKQLPTGTVIAHKTGELGSFSHDGGIVFSSKGDYIIVVLSDTDYPPGAEERIAQISKAVYDYFANKPADTN